MLDDRVEKWFATLDFLDKKGIEYTLDDNNVSIPDFKDVAKDLGTTRKKLLKRYKKRYADYLEFCKGTFQATLIEEDGSNE